MTTPRLTLGSIAAIIQSVASPLKLSQFGLISIQQDAPLNTPSLASELGMIVVIANGKEFVSLRPAFALPCWQPCTAYGTRSIVVNFG